MEYSLPFSCYLVLKSTRIYQCVITQASFYQIYSFFFSYDTLNSLKNNAESNLLYPKCHFPLKIKCYCKKKNDMTDQFLNYFNNFNKIANIIDFLNLFELNSNILEKQFLDFSKLIQKPIKSPFEIETNPNIKPITPNKAKQIKISLKIEDKTYEFLEKKKLGSGGYGEVFLYSLSGTDEDKGNYAVKFIHFTKGNEEVRESIMNSILSESQLLTSLDHENIVKSYFYFKISKNKIDYFCNIMEYCNGGTLDEYLTHRRLNTSPLTETEVLEIFIDILKGIKYARSFFSSQNKSELLMHRDLKPENIFFHNNVKTGRRIAMVGDFGLAKTFMSQMRHKTSLESSQDYQSPELANGENVSDKCDIWSLGVILYYMCFFELPWPRKNSSFLTYKIQKELLCGKELSFAGKKQKVSDKLQGLLKNMLKFNEKKRMGFGEIFENDFFKEILKNEGINNKNTMNKEKKLNTFNSHKVIHNRAITNEKQMIKLKTEKQSNTVKLEKAFSKHLEEQLDRKAITEESNDIFIETEEEKMTNVINLQNLEDELDDKRQIILIEVNENKISAVFEPGFNLSNNKQNNENIHVIFKKEANKIEFLKFLNEKLEVFKEKIQDPKLVYINALQLMIQKINLNISLNIVQKMYLCSMKNEEFGLWNNITREELLDFLTINPNIRNSFLSYIENTIKMLKGLQNKAIEEFMQAKNNNGVYLDRKNWGLDEFLGFINPKIGNWEDFVKRFSVIVEKNINILNIFIRNKILDAKFGDVSVIDRERFRIIVMLYKNLCVLINIKNIFNEMEEEKILGFNAEKLEENDQMDYLKMWDNLKSSTSCLKE